MSEECAVCREMGPLACDTHAELAALERMGYLDALSEHEDSTVADMMNREMEVSHNLDTWMDERFPGTRAYYVGRRDALRELIENRTE